MYLWVHSSGLIQQVWDDPLDISRGHSLYSLNKICIFSVNILFVLASSVDNDEMLHSGSSQFAKARIQ